MSTNLQEILTELSASNIITDKEQHQQHIGGNHCDNYLH